MPARKLTSEQRLSRAIDIMEALYAAGEKGMDRSEICSRFDITGASLDEIVDIISTLADRESGARVICECRDERVILTGEAGRVLPLRLSAAEGAVLNHELESLGIEPATAARIRRALLPRNWGITSALSTPLRAAPIGSSSIAPSRTAFAAVSPIARLATSTRGSAPLTPCAL